MMKHYHSFEELAQDVNPRQRRTHETKRAQLGRTERLRQAREIVENGKCPKCGTPLIRNSALSGWWQCGAYASPDFRKPEFRDLPSCHFQIFTQ